MPTDMLWPAEPPFANASEHRVWSALRDQLGPHDLLIANQHFTDHQRDYELDLAVVLDGHGVVVLEVKGGTVWNEGGKWKQKRSDGEGVIDPVEQARKAKHVLKDWVYESAAWAGRTPIRWAHAVVLPGVEIDPQFDTPDCHRWMVIDRNDLGDIVSRLRTILLTQDTAYRLSDGADTAAIYEALEGRFLPQRTTMLPVAERVAEHDEVVERLSAEQAKILDLIQMVDRVEVRGGAGSGKTWLAVEQARRLTKAGQRVALLSYSRGLAGWMQRRTETFHRKERPAYVGTFHGLGATWGAPDADNDDPNFWEVELPERMLDLVGQQSWGSLFDAIVIDESQDFADSWWPVILESLKFEDGGLYVFSDEGQRIFQRFGDAPAGLVTLVLDRNLRNTKQISKIFSSMAPNRMKISTHDGADVEFVPCAYTEALDCADDAVERLMDAGWEASDIAVLATGPRHPEQKHRQEAGWQSYWDSFWDKDQVFYGHVSGFKGLERPAIVLAVNEFPGRDRAKERLYVGLSRARDLLVVCGDPAHIEAVGGPAVLKKLRGVLQDDKGSLDARER